MAKDTHSSVTLVWLKSKCVNDVVRSTWWKEDAVSLLHPLNDIMESIGARFTIAKKKSVDKSRQLSRSNVWRRGNTGTGKRPPLASFNDIRGEGSPLIPEQKLKSNHSNSEAQRSKKLYTWNDCIPWHWARESSFNFGGVSIVDRTERTLESINGPPLKRNTFKCWPM